MRKAWILIAGVGALGLGCNPVADENRSAVHLTAAFSDEGSSNAIGFFSDVVGDSGEPADDFFEVEVFSTRKNTGSAISTPFYTVDFLAYEVSFTRPDGKNEPGVDVPFPLTTAIGGTVEPDAVAELNLLFVTKEMKLEAPLRNLWFGDGKRIFSTMHFRIFGRDRVENTVEASTSTVVVFEDL